MTILMTVIGLVLLLGAGDLLVRGAIALSLRLGLSAALISLTVVAFGTSAPELLIAVEAALKGAPDIALGNVVGSNIANVLLVLGAAALIAPLCDHSAETRRNYLLMLGATALFIALSMRGVLDVFTGAVMLAALIAILWHAYRRSERGEASLDSDEIDEVDASMPGWKIAGLIGAGLVGLPLGAHLLVEGASSIAAAAGVSEAAIGLTLVAVGTSLPELAATVSAAMRGRGDVALGNAIGSNMFNALAIIGGASLISPIAVAPGFLTFDMPIMALCALVIGPFIFANRRIGRTSGCVFLAAYVGYTAFVLL